MTSSSNYLNHEFELSTIFQKLKLLDLGPKHWLRFWWGGMGPVTGIEQY